MELCTCVQSELPGRLSLTRTILPTQCVHVWNYVHTCTLKYLSKAGMAWADNPTSGG